MKASSKVTADALDFSLESLGIAGPGLLEHLMGLSWTPPVFQEVPLVLRRVRQARFVTTILANGPPAILEAAVRSAGIGERLDKVFSAQEVHQFKTRPCAYAHALHQFGLRPEQVSFQSFNAWDARLVWCNGYGQRCERLPGRPNHEICTLAELPDLLGPPS